MNGPKRKLTGPALIGRRIGITMFWCMAVFVISASFRSVLSELYGSPAPSADPAEAASCAQRLQSLHDDLLAQAGDELRAPRDPARMRSWFTDWDKRFVATGDGCAALSETRHDLQTLRERVQAMLRAYARDELPMTERIERALERYVPRSTPPRKT